MLLRSLVCLRCRWRQEALSKPHNLQTHAQGCISRHREMQGIHHSRLADGSDQLSFSGNQLGQLAETGMHLTNIELFHHRHRMLSEENV